VGPNDWESEHIAADSGQVEAFELDQAEVTQARYAACVAAKACSRSVMLELQEPGAPMTLVSGEQAQAYCRWSGGALVTRAQWLSATATLESLRFPWGQTGLVCRRASFGLVAGPCGEGGSRPEWTGTRPDGKSPLGILDLAGNVAELVREPDGSLRVRGGSFRSRMAAELKSWATRDYVGPQDDVGWRCAYSTSSD